MTSKITYRNLLHGKWLFMAAIVLSALSFSSHTPFSTNQKPLFQTELLESYQKESPADLQNLIDSTEKNSATKTIKPFSLWVIAHKIYDQHSTVLYKSLSKTICFNRPFNRIFKVKTIPSASKEEEPLSIIG